MIKKFAIFIAVVVLSGCAVTYTNDGQKYDSKEKFQQAVDATISNVLSTITPLPTPLNKRNLLVAIPSEATYVDEATKRFVKAQGTQPNGNAKEIIENLSKSNYKYMKMFFDVIQKKNVYASTQLLEMQSMTGSFAASTDTDTLYFVEPSQGSGQWFYTSFKNGKQIFAYDRSNPTVAGKAQAFIDAMQAQAIRD